MKPCSNCSGNARFLFKSRDYNRKITAETFSHYKCDQCDLIFIDPIPEDLGIYYPDSYYAFPQSADDLKGAFPHEIYKIDLIKPFVQKGRLLEIGPSMGPFAYLAKNAGYETETIEMDSRCSQFLNEALKIPTVNSADASQAIKTLQPFDIVCMWHVIEHLTNPWETLNSIADKINKNGILVIAAPNPNALQFKIMGKYWPHVDAPRHVTLIPYQLIEKKLNQLGFKLELVTTNDKGAKHWNIFGWEFFFSNMTANQTFKNYFRKIGKIVAGIFSNKDGVEGMGSAYTVVFRKVN